MNDLKEGSFPEDDFEVEVSAIGPEGEDGASSLVEAPLPQGLSRKERTRRLAFGGAMLLAALLILFGSVPALRGQALSLFGGTTSLAPGSVTVTPRPEPDKGWSLAGPRNASEIAFAPSAPTTAYTCGAQQPSEDLPVPLIVSVSRDAGNSWQMLSTPARGVTCDLTVNPTNARDVVLLAIPCMQCTAPLVSTLYRSFDGGKHWSAWSLPLPGPRQPADLLYTQWIWVGSTLVIAPYLFGDIAYVRLAASVDGQPFVWLKTDTLFAGTPADTGIDRLLATSTVLYIEMYSQKNCPPTCPWFMQSRDDGVSWSPFNPVFQDQPVYLLATGADGRTLLGQAVHNDPPYSRTYLRSIDGGATWSALAPKPVGLATGLIYEGPDGSLYASFEQDPADPNSGQTLPAVVGIYALAPGATAWRYISPPPKGGWFVVAWDNAGHPSALWGPVDTNMLIPGMERRQL